MKIAILSDFDGTITLQDTAYIVLKKFVAPGWEIYDEKYLAGELSLAETLEKLYTRINTPKEKILETIDEIIEIRSNFKRLIYYCSKKNLPFIIVSAGIDFIIDHILEKQHLQRNLPVHAVKTAYTPTGLKVNVPTIKNKDSIDFKQDIVQKYKKLGYTVYFIGDGSSDFGAVKEADLSFVVKESSLEKFCHDHELDYISFTDFSEIISFLEKIDFQ